MKTCPICECEQSEGLLCHSDTTRLERELGDVAAIVGELDITISKQAKIGNTSGPGGLARERAPLNWGAVQVADDLHNTLTTWARDVSGDMWPMTVVDRGLGTASELISEPGKAAARLMLSEIDAIRRHPAVTELVDEITDAITQARRVVDRPVDRQFVGPCLAEFEGVTCEEDILAKRGASFATCRVCGITHDVAERRAWLLDQARDRLFTVREAAQMVGEVGNIKVSEDRIRGYLRRGRIAYHTERMIRLGDLLTVVIDENEKQERRSA